jgi:hypothetical protein
MRPKGHYRTTRAGILTVLSMAVMNIRELLDPSTPWWVKASFVIMVVGILLLGWFSADSNDTPPRY